MDTTFTGIGDWNIENAKAGSPVTTVCGTLTLVGGYNSFGVGASASKK
jgi:hypothetical protein